MQLTEKEKDILQRLEKYIYQNKVSNEFQVQIIELAGSFLNLQTISNYSRDKNLSYNGVKKCRQIIELFKIKFVIDNL